MGNPWTPGPYFRDQRCVYTLQGPEGKQENRWAFVIQSAGKCPLDELDAVAALLHAAPEMAEALAALVARCDDAVFSNDGWTPSELEAARALLARIRGETP